MTMKIAKTNFLMALFLALLLCVIRVSPAYAAPKTVVGAMLKEYRKPSRDECDILVAKRQYQTIQSAIDAATVGDRVCVKAGKYNEDVLINKPITLSGRGPKKSIINGQNSSGNVIVNADNVVIEGFTINGAGSDYTHAALTIGEGLNNVSVQYNRIKAGDGALALRADGGQHGHLIRHNVLEGNNAPQIALVNGQPSVGKPSDDIRFLNNSFIGTVEKTERQDTGIALISQATNNEIKRNAFDVTGTIQELIQVSYSSNTINENNLNSDTFSDLAGIPVKVRAGYDGTTNAENNWWSDLDPSDNIQGDIDFTPFAAKPFKQKKY